MIWYLFLRLSRWGRLLGTSNISCLLRGWQLLTWTWEGVVPPKTLHFLDSSSVEDNKGDFLGTSVTGPPYTEDSNRSLDYLLACLDLSLTRDLALVVAHLMRWHVGRFNPRQRLQWFRPSIFDNGPDQSHWGVPKSRVSNLTQWQAIAIAGIYLS